MQVVVPIKRSNDDSTVIYNACLVTKGFNQCHMIDFKEKFLPIVQPHAIKTVPTLALSNKWNMHHIDVNNVFCQCTLHEDVFME